MTYLLLRAWHLLFMGVWFGVSLFMAGDVKRTLASKPDDTSLGLLADRVGRTGRFAGLCGVMTFVSGVALIVYLGGMGSVPWPVHAALTLTLVMIGLGIGINRTWTGIHAAATGGGDTTALVKRLSMLGGIFHLLWLVCFALMVFRYMIAGPAGG